ncbi:hypothetical protein FVEN_g5114 [Fusarium venenatum]|uniref:Uncharacterized protein n=1 Tax=Fusarium venenatum TaxID=56646 RepID=A0A2L2SZK6_9HYPO|nr:uncharacterized protein FVRRES_07014 [Fusarium venenatum]KAG8357080.1 hypothetical protein FVEN_g5114 [Fusarium venenatum]CEI62578.1 unnamed protein product [Fusarium venenatum]
MDRRRLSVDHDDTRQAKRHKAIAHRYEVPSYARYTVAWICALHIEMAAARAMLDERHPSLPGRVNDTNSYVLGTMHKHDIVIACLPADQYGTNNAASVLSNMKSTFPNIKIGLMVGIGGGVPTKADIRLGDIVVGIRVMQFDLGKTLSGGFQRTAIPKIPDSSIRTVISNLRSEHELKTSRVPMILEDKMNEYPAYCLPDEADRLFQSTYSHESSKSDCDRCDQSKLEPRKIRGSTNPVIHYGAIASGNQVMKDATTRDEIARELDVICFEMEAAGLMDIMPCLPIRGICDYSDSHKAKEWQRYAAATAAAYAYEFLEVWGGDAQSAENDHLLTQNENVIPSGRCERLLEYLDFEDIDSRKITIKTAYSKTCQWFLKHPDFLSWTNPEEISKHHGFLWIKGKPGAGKSTIMKFLYSRAKKKDRKCQTLTGSFFFNARGAELEKTVSGMYRSLLLQLLKGFPDLQCVLDNPELVPLAQAGCPSLNVLKDLLRNAVLRLAQRSFTCYIDALDECDEQQVMDMVEYFEELAEQCTEDCVRLQICFSSRHYPFIDIRRGLCLILEEQAGHTSDLETYIKSHLRVRDPPLLTELQEKMLEKAAGVFMWVVLVVEVLNAENRRGRLSLKTRLEEVPSGLSELFKDLLRRDKTNMEELLLSILWILLSKRPLNPEEYYHALWSGLSLEGLADLDLPGSNAADANDCFDRCVISSSKGLAEITKAKQPTVQFIHESVRDFLIKDKGLHELWPEIRADWESFGHDRLKLCCHSYVKVTETERQQPLPPDMEKTYPFLEYASQFVLHHADHASNAVCQEAFLNHFPTSIWITIVNTFEKYKIRRYTGDATLIYILADRDHSGLIRTLVKADPENHDINRPAEKERYRYPLIAAMAKGHKNSVVELLGLPSTVYDGVDITEALVRNIDTQVQRDRNPLLWACEHGHLAIVKILLSKPQHKPENSKNACTPLMLASKNGHIEIVKFLIDDGADIHANIKQENAISLASANGHVGTVRILFDAGADPWYRNAQGASLLCLAVRSTNEQVVRFFLEEVAINNEEGSFGFVNRKDESGLTPLHYAVRQKGSVEVMALLLAYGADIHARDFKGNTCLMLAVTKEGVEFLLENGADVTTQNEDGFSCLHEAIRSTTLFMNYRLLVKIYPVLLKNGANVNARDRHGRTCLHLISSITWTLPPMDAVFRLLDLHKIEPNARDYVGNTPLHYLYQAERAALSPFLKQFSVDLNAKNHKGETPLHHASQMGTIHFVRTLLERGANINSVDNNGQTPLDRAFSKDLVDLLVAKGGIKGTISRTDG